MNFSDEYKRIILSIWMHNERLEDAKKIPPSIFEDYAKVAGLIKNGTTDLVKLSKGSGIGIKELAMIVGEYHPEAYNSIMLQYTEEARKEELEKAFGNGASISEIERIIEKYHTDDAPKPHISEDIIEDYLKELDKRLTQKHHHTGLMDIDKMYDIRKGELTAVGARPSTGKSTFMLQVGKHIAANGGKVLFMPLEMTQHQTVDRLVLGYCSKDLTSKQIKTGVMSVEQYQELSIVLDRIDKNIKPNLTICDSVRTLEDMELLIEEQQPDVVIIDQLQQMISNRQQFLSVRERFSYMTSNLKRIALEKNVAILLACQLNRTAKGQTPSMEQLKESGSIEEDSDNVFLLYRDEEKEGGWNGDNRLIVCQLAKQREGTTGQCDLMLIPDKFTFRGIQKEI